MATRKAPTAAQIDRALKFRIDWIKDPVPIFKSLLEKDVIKQIEQAKKNFAKQIDQIVKNR